MTSKSYISLTREQKIKIRTEFFRRVRCHKDKTAAALALWAKNEFSLQIFPGVTIVRRVLREKELTQTDAGRVFKATRVKTGAHDELEKQLYNLICHQRNNRRNINGDIVKAHAHKLPNGYNAAVAEHRKIFPKFSEGWLTNFKRRWGPKVFKSHGESGDADQEVIDDNLPALQSFFAGYSRRDIFNADECGLQYKMAPYTTIATSAFSGRKKQKDRFTVLVSCNADGSEKFELMFIGHAERPRPFKKKYGRDYGLDYLSNQKAWMTADLFYS